MNGACNSTKKLAPAPGARQRGRSSLNLNNKDIDLSFYRLGHAPGVGLVSTWGQKLERWDLRWRHIDCVF